MSVITVTNRTSNWINIDLLPVVGTFYNDHHVKTADVKKKFVHIFDRLRTTLMVVVWDDNNCKNE